MIRLFYSRILSADNVMPDQMLPLTINPDHPAYYGVMVYDKAGELVKIVFFGLTSANSLVAMAAFALYTNGKAGEGRFFGINAVDLATTKFIFDFLNYIYPEAFGVDVV
ncbi:MAG: hypothetical protein GXO34_03500 [Deltaproteobacteria bacterium]|nr:hypothetical protein [Deltaproteobacteria bacterium]